MSIDRLRYFAAVVETKNLRQAAELVGISPPSMSKAISVLENELRCQLIHPEGRGIGITERGFQVYQNLAPLLEEYRKFHLRVQDGETVSEKLKIATFEVFSSYFMSAFLSQEEDLGALLLEMSPGRIEQAVSSGIVDAGLTYIPSPTPGLDFTEVGSFRFGIYGLKKWESKPFEEWPFAIPITELRIHSSEINSLDMWPLSAPKRLIKYQFELLETALQTSRKGLSVLHCPDFIVQLQNADLKTAQHLSELPNPSGYKLAKRTKIYLVTLRGGRLSEKNFEGKFAKFIRSFA